MNKCMLVFMVFGVFCSVSIADVDLEAYYNFDNVNNLNLDFSGNLNNLVFTSEPVGVDTALSFDGVDDYATTSVNPDGSFSVSVWVKPADVSVNSYFLTSNSGARGYNLCLLNGTFRATVYGLEYGTMSTSVYAEAGKWYHIVLVFEADGDAVDGVYSGTSKIYVDGALKVEAADYYSPAPTAVTYVASGNNTYFGGAIDDLAFFSGALEQSQVSMLAACQYSPLEIAEQKTQLFGSTPVAYYPLSDPNDLTVACKDFGGGGNNLTFNGEPTAVDEFLSFDGVDDYATTSVNPDGSFTVALWLNTVDPSVNSYIVTSNTGARGYNICLINNTLRATVYGLEYGTMSTSVYAQANQWYHVALVFKAEGDPVDGIYSGTSYVYVDGELKVEAADYYMPASTAVTYVASGNNTYFDGLIDDLAFWDAALNSDEIAALAMGTCTPLNIQTGESSSADFNDDCCVDFQDFGVLAGQWQSKSLK